MTIKDRIYHYWHYGSALNKLIMINAALFISAHLAQGIAGSFFGQPKVVFDWINTWLALPPEVNTWITRPWTLFTYIFVHYRFSHVLFNLLVLHFAGELFMNYLGERRMLRLFFYGGLAGGILYLLTNTVSITTSNISMVGASAGIIALMVAGALYMPQMEVRLWGMFRVKYWMLAAAVVVFDILNLPGSNTGGHLAHLGGAAMAYFFVQSMQGNSLGKTVKRWFSRPGKKTSKKSNPKKRTKASKAENTAKMDAILDKIRQTGYDKLTDEEKAFLFKMSQE